MNRNDQQSQSFAKKLDSLDDIFAFIDEFVQTHEIPDDDAFAIRLSIDEIFANMVKHNKGGLDSIDLSLACADGHVSIELVDYEVEEFTVRKTDDDDMTSAAEAHRTGGRGVYLVMQIMDELQYEYRDGNSYVRMRKKLG